MSTDFCGLPRSWKVDCAMASFAKVMPLFHMFSLPHTCVSIMVVENTDMSFSCVCTESFGCCRCACVKAKTNAVIRMLY